MHEFDREVELVAEKAFKYSFDRLKNVPELDRPRTADELSNDSGISITREGVGLENAYNCFIDVIAPACISSDHPLYLAYIPAAPSKASKIMDVMLGSSSLYGGSWQEGSGVVFAENQALRFLSDRMGYSSEAGGCFVQGGTVGNLSALVAARARARVNVSERVRLGVAASVEAHSSIKSVCSIMDVDYVEVKVGEDRVLRGSDVAKAAKEYESSGGKVFAVVGTAGSTNLGVIDDLSSVGVWCREAGVWFHVDGAYGLAAALSDKYRPLLKGVELSDSFIVDPHKMLFAPYDACALVYRDANDGRRAHKQDAEYLDSLDVYSFNPSEYGVHLSRRARGLPFWFALLGYGYGKFAEGIEECCAKASAVAGEIKRREYLELINASELSIVVFKRRGWVKADYYRWCDDLLSNGVGFVTPSLVDGDYVLRFAIVNPDTDVRSLVDLLDSMK